MAGTVKDTAKTRTVAILAADGVEEDAVRAMQQALTTAGARSKVFAHHGGALKGASGGEVEVDYSLLTVGSVLFDAVFVPGGAASTEALAGDAAAVLFVREAYKHCKAIAVSGTGTAVGQAAQIDACDVLAGADRVSPPLAGAFVKAIAQPRDWSRESKAQTVPA